MVQLFAHHGGPLMEALDFLHIEPVTPLQHDVAFASYGLFVAVVAFGIVCLGGLGMTARGWFTRRRSVSSDC